MPTAGVAVVIGASVGGLLAARALHDSYGRVIVLDRDALPATPTVRRTVPQGHQLHVLLARGREVMDELFPGLSAELCAAGARLVDLHGDVHWYNDGFRMRRAASELIAVGMTRPALELAIRHRVAALPGVEIRPRSEVVALTSTMDGSRITGVEVVVGSDGSAIVADLVVDASGRGSRTPIWLTDLGYPPPHEQKVHVGVTYVTRLYHREPHHLDGLSGALTNAVPGSPRAGIVAVQEGNRIAVALSGMLGEVPPTDHDGMLAFAEGLAAPQIADVIRTGAPAGDPVRMRFPSSIRRHYERLDRFPDGYLVLGDALCSFNPIYGQGMTVAALEALLLQNRLASGPLGPGAARGFFRAAARLVEAPWSIAVGTDLRFPSVDGPRTPKVRCVNAFVHRLHRAATTDVTLGAAFLRVLNLASPPTSLLAPRIAWRVLRGPQSTNAAGGVEITGPRSR
jgi:2-polyprenyl-6-methoxyphenol hydroxylase-like FAD-dependent oxidoreductase